MSKQTVNLWLDDLRPAPEGWFHCYTAEQAKTVVELHNVQSMSLDHDLGACNGCMKEAGCETVEDWLRKSEFQSMPHCEHVGSGYTFICWLEETGKWPPNKPVVHSANPIGARRMRQVIERAYAQ